MIENHNTVIPKIDRLGITNVKLKTKRRREFQDKIIIFLSVALLLFDQKLPSQAVLLRTDLDLPFYS